MPARDSESPDETYFNDLTQQASELNGDRPSPTRTSSQDAPNENTVKQKRIACVLCRKRKLRCDGARPACATCKRLSHDCAYDEVRKKSGPKRGYVKLLEQRLQQVETLLRSQDSTDSSRDAPRQDTGTAYVANTIQQGPSTTRTQSSNTFDRSLEALLDSQKASRPTFPGENATTTNSDDPDSQWEMIGLGLQEPLPPQDVMDELYHIYFTKIHPSLPLIHRPRFMAALDLAPHMRPPVCLRYSMWTMAASVADKYDALQEHFYHRARKYAQLDEMRGHGEVTITLAHCQAWALLCSYEFKNMYFPRAWLSSGRAVRLAQMMQLHRLDGAGLDVKQCLPPPKDWTEREERRRTFWMCFAIDRYASIGTGWPMIIDERDIMTNLPASEDAFEWSKAMHTGSLEQGLSPMGAAKLESFGGIVLTAAMFGRNLLHLHRPTPEDNDNDLNGAYWTRHRQLEQILLQTSLHLPDHLRMPGGHKDPNVVFTNMCIQTSAICLHQAAIFKADKHQLPASVGNESKIRCVTAAAEIASIMRAISHMDLSAMNPFISFCVYVAARVFVQYLKTRPNDQQMNSSLQFLLQAMQALRRKNPLTESFLVQLDLDLEGAGIPRPYLPVQKKNSVIPVNSDPVGCSSIYEIRETQAQNAPINQFANSRTTAMNTTGQFTANNRQPPVFGSAVSSGSASGSGSGIEIAPSTAGFMPMRNIQDLQKDFSPHRGAVPGTSTFIFNDGSTNDMDLSGSGDQPSPSTLTSQSQSSYSPGQQAKHQHLPYRASPRFTPSQTPGSQRSQRQTSSAALYLSTPSSTNVNSNLNLNLNGTLNGSSPSSSLSTNAANPPDLTMSAYPSDAINDGAYSNGFDWEFSGMSMDVGGSMDDSVGVGGVSMGSGGGMGSGITPDLGSGGITPGTWNSMLESVMESESLSMSMGWGDVVGVAQGEKEGV